MSVVGGGGCIVVAGVGGDVGISVDVGVVGMGAGVVIHLTSMLVPIDIPITVCLRFG